MAKAFDVTGIIAEGMWNYEPPFPNIDIKPLPPVPWVKGDVFCEIFDGLHSQTGTYLETPAHYYGNDDPRTYLLIDVPIEKIVNVPCTLLDLGLWDMDASKGRPAITAELLKACPGADSIKDGEAIIFSTGWGRYWFHKDYLELSPYLTKDAMDWVLSHNPTIFGGDISRWDNFEQPQGFWEDFYSSDTLMIGPLVDLEKVGAAKCKLTALPLKAVRTSAAPTRVVLTVD